LEREVILAHNLQHVFFDIERAIDIYIEREKNKNREEDAEYLDELFFMEQEHSLFQNRGAMEEGVVAEDIGGIDNVIIELGNQKDEIRQMEQIQTDEGI
jgi:hypothetical protein